jgi:hypothetical protein
VGFALVVGAVEVEGAVEVVGAGCAPLVVGAGFEVVGAAAEVVGAEALVVGAGIAVVVLVDEQAANTTESKISIVTNIKIDFFILNNSF